MSGVPMAGDTVDPPDMNRYFTLVSADLVVPNQEAWRPIWDFEAIKQMSESLPGNPSIQNKALVVANEITNNLDITDPGCIAKCRKIAEQVLRSGFKAGKDLRRGSQDINEVYTRLQ
jgi:alpha-mannosidase